MEKTTNNNNLKNASIFLGGLAIGIFIGLAFYKFVLEKPQELTFYAHIVSFDSETRILISGVEENEINFRGEMYIKVDKNTDFIIDNNKAALEDFNEGDLLRVTLPRDTMIMESYPSQVVEPALILELIRE